MESGDVFSMRSGDAASDRSALLSEIYRELHEVASREMYRERAEHTLQPTALVHEAYLRLQTASALGSLPRHEILALATTVIRNVLVDHARRRRSERHGGGERRVPFDVAEATAASRTPLDGADHTTFVMIEGAPADILSVDEAIDRLAGQDSRKATVVRLRFFGGMTNEEIALHLGVTARTVTNDWNFARAWLRRELLHAS